MDSAFDNSDQLRSGGTKTNLGQPADPFGDVVVVCIASGLLLVSLVGSILSCVCCFKRSGRHSRYRSSSSSGSIRDTVQLQDLLSKPSLADPESVFSEFLLDARLSDDASTAQTAATLDETKLNSVVSSRSSSLAEVNEDSAILDKKGSKNYKKQSKKRPPASLNNNNSNSSAIYKKNSSHNQTLQNNLAYASSQRRKVENKLEHYDKKATEMLQQHQESDVKVEKMLNTRKDSGSAVTVDALQEHPQRKPSLDALDAKRHSTGSESVSFSSSARGSICHDIGVPANALRQQRASIFPRVEGGIKRDGFEEDVCSLPEVLENPDLAHEVTIRIQNETECEIGASDDQSESSLLPATRENIDTQSCVVCCEDQNKNNENETRVSPCQIEDQKECRVRNKRKCMQASYSVDTAYSSSQHQPHQCEKLPERISLNLHIDFHFPHQGQCHGEGRVPIVVCSPIAFNNDSTNQDTSLANVTTSNPERESPACCQSKQSEDEIKQDHVLKIHKSPQAVSEPNTSKALVKIGSNEKAYKESPDTLRTKSRTVQMTARIPYWVKNRLSEPVEFCQWIEKIKNSPRLKRRSFTIADFKSLKFKSITSVYDENDMGEMQTLQKKSKAICGNSKEACVESPSTSHIVKDNTEELKNETRLPKEDSNLTCKSKDKTSDKITVDDAILKSTSSSEEVNSDKAMCPDQVIIIESGEDSKFEIKPSTLDETDMPKKSETEISTVDSPEGEIVINQKETDLPDINTAMSKRMIEGSEIPETADELENKIADQTVQTMKAEKDVRTQEPVIVTDQQYGSSEVDEANSGQTFICENAKCRQNDDATFEKESDDQQQSRSSMRKSSSLGFMPAIPFTPTLGVAFNDGKESSLYQTFPKSSRGAFIYDDSVVDNGGDDIDYKQADGGAIQNDNTGILNRTDLDDDVSSDGYDDVVEISGRHQIYPMPIRQKAYSECNVMEDGIRMVNYSQSLPKSARPNMMIDDTIAKVENGATEIGFGQPFPKSNTPKTRSPNAATTSEVCAANKSCDQNCPRLTQQKCRSADTTMESDVMEVGCSQTLQPSITKKASSANTTMDANAGSDDSDYDNPWDSLDNAVKRASMKYHKRPSAAASSARDLMLKSAEDLGRLIEMAEARRKKRLNSTKSTSHDLECDDCLLPSVFTRASPLRHTVKGVMSRGSNDELTPFGAKPTRGKAGTKSLRASKDDSFQAMKTGDDSKVGSNKTRKLFYSPENKKKVKKSGH